MNFYFIVLILTIILYMILRKRYVNGLKYNSIYITIIVCLIYTTLHNQHKINPISNLAGSVNSNMLNDIANTISETSLLTTPFPVSSSF